MKQANRQRKRERHLTVIPASPFCACDDAWAGFIPGFVHLHYNRPTPLVVDADEITFRVSLAEGWGLSVLVEAAWWEEAGQCARIFRAEPAWSPRTGTYGHLAVPLLPEAVNVVRFQADGPRGQREQLVFTVTSTLPALWLEPALFRAPQDPPTKEVTEQELRDALARVIAEVKKVSRDLGRLLDDNVEFWDEDDTRTTTGDPPVTRVSRPQWRQGLLNVKCTADPAERARREEDVLRQAVSQMLHEAGHKEAVLNDTYRDTTSSEEERNTVALIQRLIRLLETIDRRLGGQPADLGDGSGLDGEDLSLWAERLRTVIERQLEYRWQRVAETRQPSRGRVELVRRVLESIRRQLDEIRADASRTEDQKREAAREVLRDFETATAATRRRLEEQFDVRWRFDLNEETLEIDERVEGIGVFEDRPIPTWPF